MTDIYKELAQLERELKDECLRILREGRYPIYKAEKSVLSFLLMDEDKALDRTIQPIFNEALYNVVKSSTTSKEAKEKFIHYMNNPPMHSKPWYGVKASMKVEIEKLGGTK